MMKPNAYEVDDDCEWNAKDFAELFIAADFNFNFIFWLFDDTNWISKFRSVWTALLPIISVQLYMDDWGMMWWIFRYAKLDDTGTMNEGVGASYLRAFTECGQDVRLVEWFIFVCEHGKRGACGKWNIWLAATWMDPKDVLFDLHWWGRNVCAYPVGVISQNSTVHVNPMFYVVWWSCLYWLSKHLFHVSIMFCSRWHLKRWLKHLYQSFIGLHLCHNAWVAKSLRQRRNNFKHFHKSQQPKNKEPLDNQIW